MNEKVDVPLTSMVVTGAVQFEGTEEERQALLAKRKPEPPEPVYSPKWIVGLIDEVIGWSPWLDARYHDVMPEVMKAANEEVLEWILRSSSISEAQEDEIRRLWHEAEWDS